jgi:hypothetical protein
MARVLVYCSLEQVRMYVCMYVRLIETATWISNNNDIWSNLMAIYLDESDPFSKGTIKMERVSFLPLTLAGFRYFPISHFPVGLKHQREFPVFIRLQYKENGAAPGPS